MRNFLTALLVYGYAESFFNECCRTIRMQKVWRYIGLRQHIVEQLSILRQEVVMIRVRLVPVKHGMSDVMLALKEAEIKAEAIPVRMHNKNTVRNQLKYKG